MEKKSFFLSSVSPPVAIVGSDAMGETYNSAISNQACHGQVDGFAETLAHRSLFEPDGDG